MLLLTLCSLYLCSYFRLYIDLKIMGVVEELPEDCGSCPVCGKIAETKCTGCRQIYYCNRECQKKHWKKHKPECKALPYRVRLQLYSSILVYRSSQLSNTSVVQIQTSAELGNYLTASRDLKEGEVIFSEPPLVVGPTALTIPVCLHCYTPVDGS